MRLIYLLLTALLFPLCAFTQKQDFIWYTGYDWNFQVPGSNNIKMGFNANRMSFEYLDLKMPFQNTNTSICTDQGNMLLYSTPSLYQNNEQ